MAESQCHIALLMLTISNPAAMMIHLLFSGFSYPSAFHYRLQLLTLCLWTNRVWQILFHGRIWAKQVSCILSLQHHTCGDFLLQSLKFPLFLMITYLYFGPDVFPGVSYQLRVMRCSKQLQLTQIQTRLVYLLCSLCVYLVFQSMISCSNCCHVSLPCRGLR